MISFVQPSLFLFQAPLSEAEFQDSFEITITRSEEGLFSTAVIGSST